MSSISPRMGFKVWDGTDPFLRQDFNDNFAKIEAAPGDFICTSTTLPAWGAGQANRRAFLTDQRRILAWSGSAWQDLQTPGWAGTWAVNANQGLAPNVTGTYTFGSYTLVRPGIINVIGFAQVQSSTVQLATFTLGLNGSYGNGGQTRWAVNAFADIRQVTTMRAVNFTTPTTVTLTGRITVGTGAGAVVAQLMQAVAFLSA